LWHRSRDEANKEKRDMSQRITRRAGKIKYGLFGWLIGLPLPIIILLLFYRGCDF
jgi:hypothetical protein